MPPMTYEQYRDSENSAGQYGQAFWNLASDPLAGLTQVFGGGGPRSNLGAYADQNPQTSFTNPLGLDFSGGIGAWNAELAEDRDLFESMTDADWAQFSHMTQQQQASFLQTKRKQVAAEKKARAEADAKQKEADARKVQQDAIIKKLQAFADEMNMPIDQLLKNDDFAKAINASTFANAQSTAYGRGGGSGGMSNLNADYASKKALLGYQMQRQAAGNQAYNQAFGMLANQNATAEDMRRYNQGMDLQLQQAQAAAQYQAYMQKQSGMANTGGLLGGIIGGAYGGAEGAAAGQKIGSAAGGTVYSNNNPYTPYQYQYPSGIKGGGYGGNGLGGGGYGGNY